VEERSVDFVIANLVLEHVPDPLAALGEWLRVLRPGGYAYVVVADYECGSGPQFGSGKYGVPLHAFTRKTFADLLGEATRQFQAGLIELRLASSGDAMEYIAILRKV
jgi:ubiquinone/menaquinone biosynthesis C-methylase UbiE